MSSQEKESYKDYLVRTVTQEIGNIFNQKMDEAKRELKDINYKLALENTEEILSEENINKCVNRAKEAATTISESDTYKKAKESIKKVTETEEFKDGMNDLKDFGAKRLTDTKK